MIYSELGIFSLQGSDKRHSLYCYGKTHYVICWDCTR